jgi:hypothetical protein
MIESMFTSIVDRGGTMSRIVRNGIHDMFDDTFMCLACAGLTYSQALDVMARDRDYQVIDDTLLALSPDSWEMGLRCDVCLKEIVAPIK